MSTAAASPRQTITFDGWVLRTDIAELARDGRRIRLQDQPFLVLQELLARPGELVTREQLIKRLWPTGIVDFDTGLNSAIRKLRVALDDVDETPRYIETVKRRGYRFVGNIDPPAERVDSMSAPVVAGQDPTVPAPVRKRRIPYSLVALTAFGLATVALTILLRSPDRQAPSGVLGKPSIAILPLQSESPDDVSKVLAQSLTELLHNRLAVVRDVVVIAGSSTSDLEIVEKDPRAVGQKLKARFLLQGSAANGPDGLHLDIRLLDAASGSQLWSHKLDRPLGEVAPMLEEVVNRVAHSLGVDANATTGSAPVAARINLDAYQLYVRGEALMANDQRTEMNAALELFRRATSLDPGFARGYLALAQTQIKLISPDSVDRGKQMTEAQHSLDRALELNPLLGEAWVERAELTQDQAKAEELYRKGLALAPNYGRGYAQFSDFLFSQYRKGEAFEMIDRALQIDPRSADLLIWKADYIMTSTSDVTAHDQLVNEALTINPQFQPALYELATSRWEYAGRFADAILIIERAIALDPESSDNRQLAARIYLDVDDPVAAANVVSKVEGAPLVFAEIAQYRNDVTLAAELSKQQQWFGGPVSPQAEALRDQAIRTGDFTDALRRMEARYGSGGMRMWNRGIAMVYAHTLCLAGEVDRGRKLAAATMVQVDSESVGRTQNWFSRERASAFAVLADNEHALAELAAVMRSQRIYRWWYLTDRDPLFAPLRKDPRFEALAARAKQHRAEQRAKVEEMRRRGDIPRRGA